MSKDGKSILDAVKFLDAFYSDVGLLFANLENLLSERGFRSIPEAGNRAAYSFGVSNHLGYNQSWTLKNIQRLYLTEEEINSKSQKIEKSILMSMALYPSNVFEFPTLTCGVLKWRELSTTTMIQNRWITKEICTLITPKNSWRIQDEKPEGSPDWLHSFSPMANIKDMAEFTAFFVDFVRIENSAVLERIVDVVAEIYSGNYNVSLNDSLIVKDIPDSLIKSWRKPIEVLDEGDEKSEVEDLL